MPDPRAHAARPAAKALRRSLHAVVLALALAGLVPLAVAAVAPPASARAQPTTAPPARRTLAEPQAATVVTSPARPVSLLGLGDSVTSGSSCDCTPFVDQLAGLLAARDHVRVSPVNLGEPGLTAADLASRVTEDPAVRLAVQRADVVVVTIGANDLQPALDRWDASASTLSTVGGCASGSEGAALTRVGADVGRVLDQVAALRAGRRTQVLVSGYWNVFEDGDVAAADRGSAYLRWSDALTRCLNAQIAAAVRSHDAIPVDLYAPFKGAGDVDPTPLLADDGDHPDAAGHALIARVLLAAVPTVAG